MQKARTEAGKHLVCTLMTMQLFALPTIMSCLFPSQANLTHSIQILKDECNASSNPLQLLEERKKHE